MSIERSLSNVAGGWAGYNRMRVLPDDAYAESAATASVALVAQGKAATITYTWADGGQPQDGALLLTNDERPGLVDAAWVDSWHQGPQWMTLRGTIDDDGVIRLAGSYGGGGWRVAIDPTAEEQLRMTMDNIFEASDYQVVEASYRRIS